jgi:hypothetical protein
MAEATVVTHKASLPLLRQTVSKDLINSSASLYLGLIKYLNGLGYLEVNIIRNPLLRKALNAYIVKRLTYSPLGMSVSPVLGSTQFESSIVARIEETVSHIDEKARYLPGQILKQKYERKKTV